MAQDFQALPQKNVRKTRAQNTMFTLFSIAFRFEPFGRVPNWDRFAFWIEPPPISYGHFTVNFVYFCSAVLNVNFGRLAVLLCFDGFRWVLRLSLVGFIPTTPAQWHQTDRQESSQQLQFHPASAGRLWQQGWQQDVANRHVSRMLRAVTLGPPSVRRVARHLVPSQLWTQFFLRGWVFDNKKMSSKTWCFWLQRRYNPCALWILVFYM